MEQIQFDIVKFLSSLWDEQKKEFCFEKCDFDFPANQEISCNLFTVLPDIANFATNKNEAIQNMLAKVNKLWDWKYSVWLPNSDRFSN